jgi:uncharacterized membrane-anchored protein
MRLNISALLMLCAAIATPAFAQDPGVEAGEDAAAAATAAGFPGLLDSFQYQTGDITTPNKVATLHLGQKYRYLDAGETNKLLMAWGNESDTSTQGAIIPADVEPMSEEGWAVILTYEDEGHIDDGEATEIDYDDLLKDMKKDTESANSARKEAGFEPVHLVGWAERPRYDATTKKLFWAKELDFEGSSGHILNYDVRVLGREGVLSMNAVANMAQLGRIRADMQPLIGVAEFNPGHRYAEFNSKTDRMAEYGLGALIAGGLAAKLGLFGKLTALLLAFKKFIIIGLLAAGGFLAKLFGKKKDATT